MKYFARLFPGFCLLASLLAAAEPVDLGQGLSYLRVHALGDSVEDLNRAIPRGMALVIDLRYATADRASADALKTALAQRPAGNSLFLLVSPSTPDAIGAAIGPAFTLGAPGSSPKPTVVVHTDAEADRQAYAAADAGIDLAKLITGKVEKERFDEATLVHEFKNGNPGAEPPVPPDPTLPKATSTPEKEKPAPQTDRVLQRAVHLHRALQALKRG